MNFLFGLIVVALTMLATFPVPVLNVSRQKRRLFRTSSGAGGLLGQL